MASFLLWLSFSPLHAETGKKEKEPPVEPSVGYDATLEIHRGQTKPITLRAIPSDGYDVEFKILTQPRFGTLSEIVRNSKGSVTVFYTQHGEKNQLADSFKFKIKTSPKKCWSTKTTRIQITEPPPRLDISTEALDFGPVFIGESATLPVRIRNSGGGHLQGRIIAASPWSITGSPDFELSSGKSKTIAITFAPNNPDTQLGKITFETGAKPPIDIHIQGIGEHRFEAPDKATFAESTESAPLRVKVSNKTGNPLPLSIQAPLPLETCDRIVLPANGVSEIELKIQSGFFPDKFATLLLSDGAGERLVKIQLPTPPPTLSWEAPTLNLSDVITGSTASLDITLNNIGNTPANVTLAAEGAGISMPQTSFHIEPTKSCKIPATWTFPSPGQASVKVQITNGASLPPLTFRANVQNAQTPRAVPETAYKPVPTSPTPQSSRDEKFRALSKIESEEIQKRTPSQISYRLEQKFIRTDALVFWKYHGPQPVNFTIEVEKLQRKDTLSKPFEDRLQVPNELPSNIESPKWFKLEESIVDIHQLPDGRWQGLIPGFKQGFHHVRIGAQPTGDKQTIHSAFTIKVPPLPSPWMNKWLIGSVLLLCTGYLFRNHFLRLLKVFS